MKRIAIHIIIVLILCGVFCDGYFSVSLLSSGRIWLADSEVYAADSWENVTQDDLVTAFQYYCKSRNLAIDGSIADALTSFTTTTFNKICNTLGIDVNSLQANLKKTVEGNLGLRFLMNQQGVLAYNRIFAEFLQNNDLAVGDTVNDKNIYTGKWFTDLDGNGCFIYIMPIEAQRDFSTLKPISYGTKYIYDGFDCKIIVSNSLTSQIALYHSFTVHIINNFTLNLGIYANGYLGQNNYEQYYISNATPAGYLSNSLYASYHASELRCFGEQCLYMVQNGDTLYCGHVTKELSTDKYAWDYIRFYSYNPDNLEDADVYITTNNNTINNNTYNNNYTIIYNDGDYYEDDDEPSPTTPPDGGGGGGDDPDQPSPSGPDMPDWNTPHGTGTIGSDGTFDFDIPFSLPDLNIDWSLKNIGDKFPFCIPSDIVSFYQVLAVEPEAPAIDAHIPLGNFYDWHFEADFSQYDNWARIIRIVEYVGFVITLIYFTVKLVKG